MRETPTRSAPLILALLLLTTVCGADQRGSSRTLPDMLVGALANAQVTLDPPSLIHALATHADPLIRGLAAEALGLLGERSAKEPLLRSLQTDSDQMVREVAATALARIGVEDGLTALKGFMCSSNSLVRRLTMAAELAELGEPDGFSLMAEAAVSPQASTRTLAAQFLVPFVPLPGLADERGRSPGEILLNLDGDDSEEVRLRVVRSLPSAVLKGLDYQAARSATRVLATDADPKVREAAQALLDSWRFDDEQRVRRDGGAA